MQQQQQQRYQQLSIESSLCFQNQCNCFRTSAAEVEEVAAQGGQRAEAELVSAATGAVQSRLLCSGWNAISAVCRNAAEGRAG
jgi:hypothetical protein